MSQERKKTFNGGNARQGRARDKVDPDLLELFYKDGPEIQRPGPEAVRELTERTNRALQKLVSQKLPARAVEKRAPSQYFLYTPAQQGAFHVVEGSNGAYTI